MKRCSCIRFATFDSTILSKIERNWTASNTKYRIISTFGEQLKDTFGRCWPKCMQLAFCWRLLVYEFSVQKLCHSFGWICEAPRILTFSINWPGIIFIANEPKKMARSKNGLDEWLLRDPLPFPPNGEHFLNNFIIIMMVFVLETKTFIITFLIIINISEYLWIRKEINIYWLFSNRISILISRFFIGNFQIHFLNHCNHANGIKLSKNWQNSPLRSFHKLSSIELRRGRGRGWQKQRPDRLIEWTIVRIARIIKSKKINDSPLFAQFSVTN